MPKVKITEISTTLYDTLLPLESDERRNVVRSAFALLGETADVGFGGKMGDEEEEEDGSALQLGTKAKRWMRQNQITEEIILEVFHFGEDGAEVIALDVLGSSKAAKTQNCYLLIGICGLLGSGEPSLSDADAIELCKHMRCFDPGNNATHRGAVGLSGSKKKGFTLTAPCLQDAAALVKEMAVK